jgi:uncharacterized protein
MQAEIAEKLGPLADLCRRYGVARLEVFGSAARGLDFDPKRSDFDFPVEFEQRSDLPPLEQFFGFAEALEQLLGRPVDLVEREALKASRNFIRRRAILSQAERVYAACDQMNYIIMFNVRRGESPRDGGTRDRVAELPRCSLQKKTPNAL